MAGVTLADLGGPVHPQETTNADRSVSKWYGINLRDYFAAAALQGLCASPREWLDECTEDKIAVWAYEQADAMIAARERKDGLNG
jgi:hypothetical protein